MRVTYFWSGAVMALGVGHLTLPWSEWGEPLLLITSLIQGSLLILMSQTGNILVAYASYIVFRTLYQVMITVARLVRVNT